MTRMLSSIGADLCLVERLAAEQVSLYRQHPSEMRPHHAHERSVERAYRGRQLLELLQNADDAGRDYGGAPRFLFRLSGDFLIAANAGVPFSTEGIESLVISDRSPKQLERGRHIGEKGLGFRSLLSWSDRPLVRSGALTIAFAPEHAREVASSIARDVPALRAEMDRYSAEYDSVPVPIMRFPFVPPEGDERLGLAEEVARQGYETVIVLPLVRGRRREAALADISRQAGNIGPPTLLFSNHLTEIAVDVGGASATWWVERQAKLDAQTVALQRDDSVSIWTIRRREAELPEELLDEGSGATSVALAVAAPEDVTGGRDNTLCVFFPTNVSLPTSVLAHATLETDDSRKRLIQGPAAEFSLRELANLIADVAEAETADAADPWRGLRLLAGAERCDPELEHLGFSGSLREAILDRAVFPRLDGTITKAAHVWKSPTPAWRKIDGGEWLGDFLAESPSEEVNALLEDLELSVLPPHEQSRRLERIVEAEIVAGRFDEAGKVVGTFLQDRRLPKLPLASVLVDEQSVRLASSEHVLLPPEGPPPTRPSWAFDIHFLHPSFSVGIRSIEDLTARELSRRLVEAGYAVDEYQLEAVARRLIRSAEQGAKDEPDAAQRHLDVLRCVFEMAKSQDSSAAINAPLRVLTERGNLRRASDCYVGRAYSGGALLNALYGPLGEDEFCAGPSVLQIQAPVGEVERFLSRIGVANRVRGRPLDSPYAIRQAGLQDHVRETLGRLTYPQELADQEFASAETAFADLEVYYDNCMLPDRWNDVLVKGVPEAVVAYVTSERLAYLDSGRPGGIVLRARYGQQTVYRYCRWVDVSDPALYLLREVAWVPCDDGSRAQPRKIVLSKTARRALGTAFSASAFDTQSPLLAGIGGSAAVRLVLGAAGAIESLDSLRGDDLYSLLLELPARDPNGDVAASVYRSLLEANPLDAVSPKRDEFFRRGRMWGFLGSSEGYFPVAELRYSPRTAVPEPIRRRVPLVAIDARRGATDVSRIFGVATLSPDTYEIVVDNAETPRAPWSARAATHLRIAVPHLYALRLSQRADDRGAEKRAFVDLNLVVATRLVAEVHLDQSDADLVVIDDDLKGLSSDRQIYIVSDRLNFELDPVFWRAVGDLVADVINVPKAGGDFGSLLACADEHQRTRLLDHMTGGRGAELLAQAREVLEMDEAEDEESLPLLPPRQSAPVPDGDTPQPPVLDAPALAEPMQPVAVGPTSVTPIAAPESNRPRDRGIVVTGSAPTEPVGPSSATPEDATLRVVEEFERVDSPPRFTVRASHLHGSDTFGCDILSFATPDSRDRARDQNAVSLDEVVRFIEVKGRTSRSAPVELTENQRAAAIRYGSRYYVYRVYADNSRSGCYEVAIMQDPTRAPGQQTRTQWWYDFSSGSGATWYRLVQGESAQLETLASDISGQRFDENHE